MQLLLGRAGFPDHVQAQFWFLHPRRPPTVVLDSRRPGAVGTGQLALGKQVGKNSSSRTNLLLPNGGPTGSVPAPKRREWDEVIDNLGENLIRLGTALQGLAEPSPVKYDDARYYEITQGIASAFELAFKQAEPALQSNEGDFAVLLQASGGSDLKLSATDEHNPHMYAPSLLREGRLVCREARALLQDLVHSAEMNARVARAYLQPWLLTVPHSTEAMGWELRAICNEFESEIEIGRPERSRQKEAVPISIGLVRDMATASGRLRTIRKEWFRLREGLVRTVERSKPEPAQRGAG
jgi:hypothetical protein